MISTHIEKILWLSCQKKLSILFLISLNFVRTDHTSFTIWIRVDKNSIDTTGSMISLWNKILYFQSKLLFSSLKDIFLKYYYDYSNGISGLLRFWDHGRWNSKSIFFSFDRCRSFSGYIFFDVFPKFLHQKKCQRWMYSWIWYCLCWILTDDRIDQYSIKLSSLVVDNTMWSSFDWFNKELSDLSYSWFYILSFVKTTRIRMDWYLLSDNKIIIFPKEMMISNHISRSSYRFMMISVYRHCPVPLVFESYSVKKWFLFS